MKSFNLLYALLWASKTHSTTYRHTTHFTDYKMILIGFNVVSNVDFPCYGSLCLKHKLDSSLTLYTQSFHPPIHTPSTNTTRPRAHNSLRAKVGFPLPGFPIMVLIYHIITHLLSSSDFKFDTIYHHDLLSNTSIMYCKLHHRTGDNIELFHILPFYLSVLPTLLTPI